MNLLTLRDVAEALKVSESTVRRLAREGSLAAYKVGKRGQLRIKEQDLEAFIEKRPVRDNDGDDSRPGEVDR